MSDKKDLLQLIDIAHSFGGLNVLRSVSLTVPEGALVGLIGPNGSGKTTLFNIISGYIVNDGGTVVYAGRRLSSESVQHRSRAGLVRTFQTPKIFEQLTVYENVMVGCCKLTKTTMVQDLLRTTHARHEIRVIEDVASQACVKFGLSTLRDEPSKNLTAGQRRLLEIARAAVGNPRLLLLDEPSAGLNSDEIKQLQAWLRLLKEDGVSTLLVSHDMELMTVCDIVHVLNFGEIVARGNMDQIRQDQKVRDAYLGV
jgi:ABC-type branched-subunit amino acid transport system ATPase component